MSSSRAPEGYEFVTRLSDLREGEGHIFEIGPAKDRVAVFLIQGQLFAIENKCAHGRGDLGNGDIEELGLCGGGKQPGGSSVGGLCVKCPKHRKKFDGGLFFNLETGASFVKSITEEYNPKYRVGVYGVREIDGSVFVTTSPKVPKISQTEKLQLKAAKLAKKVGLGRCICGDGAVSDPSFSGQEFFPWRLESVDVVSKDSKIFHFVATATCPPHARQARDVAWHITIRHPVKGEDVFRDYTPISTHEDLTHHRRISLLIKIYPTGVLTPVLDKCVAGDILLFSPPRATLTMPGLRNPNTESGSVLDPLTHVGFIVGGTGVAPAFQIARAALIGSHFKHPSPQVSLLFSNHTEADILMRAELDELASKHPEVIRVTHTLTREVGATWTGLTGRVDRDKIAQCMPPPSSATRVIVCGPQGMWKDLQPVLLELGYSGDMIDELEA